MGVFHTNWNFLGIIGKQFLDPGLHDVVVESDYKRLHKLVYEALQRLIWKSFLSWFEKNQVIELQSLLHDSHLLLVDLNQSPKNP